MLEEETSVTTYCKRQKIITTKQLYIFEVTPYMSTYLIGIFTSSEISKKFPGIAIGEFHFLERNVQVRVWPDHHVTDPSTLPYKQVKLRIYTPLGRSEEARKFREIS
jgi:hypothetical protein